MHTLRDSRTVEEVRGTQPREAERSAGNTLTNEGGFDDYRSFGRDVADDI